MKKPAMETPQNKQLLILSHCPSINTQALLNALESGAMAAQTEALSIRSMAFIDAQPEDLSKASGVIFLCTENIGYMSGLAKDWFDRHFYYASEHCQAMPYAVIIRAGLDGTATSKAIASIGQGMSWNEALPTLVCRGEWRENFLGQAKELGEHMAVSVDMGLV